MSEKQCNCNSVRSDVVIKVEGMACDHCKKAVEDSVGNLEGVFEVVANVSEAKVEISFDPSKIQLDKIKTVIEDAGYEVK